jgi:hypothetical protein
MPRYITSVSFRNQVFALFMCWSFGWAFIMFTPSRSPVARAVFDVIGVLLVLLSLMALRNMGRLIAAIFRSLFFRR